MSFQRLFNKFFNNKKYEGKLPDFLIIGVQKGGTNSLWHHLKQHPQLEMSPHFIGQNFIGDINKKEVHFFDNRRQWRKGMSWYKSLFNNNSQLQGKATPEYISTLNAHERMHRHVPNAKLIAILRNPVDRAYSAYNHQVQCGVSWEKKTDLEKGFNEIIQEYSEGMVKDLPAFVKKGFYATQIKSLLQYYQRDQILIVFSEDMRRDPQKVYEQIFDFLGIRKIIIPHNPDIHKRSYVEPMKPKTREVLAQIYRPHNEELFNLLGYRITDWE